MSKYLGDFATSATVYCYFHTFDSTGASVTMTNFAVGDIVVYKNGSMTQRSSTAGFTLLDTDGIDVDGTTGIHGFSIDLSDNTDASFYAAGNDYTVVVGPVTVDSKTVNFVACQFSIENRNVKANITKINSLTAGVAALQKNAAQMTEFTVVDSAFTPTATEFETSSITEATANHYVDRLVLWCTGNLAGKVVRVTAYTLESGKGHFTVTDKGEASVNGDTGILI